MIAALLLLMATAAQAQVSFPVEMLDKEGTTQALQAAFGDAFSVRGGTTTGPVFMTTTTVYNLTVLGGCTGCGSGSATVNTSPPISGDGSSGNPISFTGGIPQGSVNLSTVTVALAGKADDSAVLHQGSSSESKSGPLNLTATGNTQASLTTSSGVIVSAGGALIGGTVEATKFKGDGSQLTGLATASRITGDANGVISGSAISVVATSATGVSFTVTAPQTNTSTVSFKASGFDVGTSSFVVAGGSATIAYGLTAGSVASSSNVVANTGMMMTGYLDVEGPVAGIRLYNSASDDYGYLDLHSGNGVVQLGGATQRGISLNYNNGTQAVRVCGGGTDCGGATAGFVGVGTASPDAKLTVSDGIKAASATLTATGSSQFSLVTSSGINVQAGPVVAGSFIGSGAGLTNLPTSLGNAGLASTNTFTGGNTFGGVGKTTETFQSVSSFTATSTVTFNGVTTFNTVIALSSAANFGGVNPIVGASGTGVLYFDSTLHVFMVSENGGTPKPIVDPPGNWTCTIRTGTCLTVNCTATASCSGTEKLLSSSCAPDSTSPSLKYYSTFSGQTVSCVEYSGVNDGGTRTAYANCCQ